MLSAQTASLTALVYLRENWSRETTDWAALITHPPLLAINRLRFLVMIC